MAEVTLNHSMTVDEAFDQVVAAYSEREALVFEGQHICYRQLGEQVSALAAGLLDLGLCKGDKAAIIMPNCPAFMDAFLAIPKAGGVVVPLNPQYRHQELRHILYEAEATTAIVAPHVWGNDVLEIVQELRADLPHLRHVIVAGDSAGQDALPLSEVMDRGRGALVTAQAAPSDLFGLIYTSGTTGTPKAAMHTHYTMLAPLVRSQEQINALFERPTMAQRARMLRTVTRYARRFIRWSGKPPTLLTPSAFHALAGYGVSIGGLLNGYRVVVVERFHPAHTLETIAAEHVNVLSATPTMYAMMISLPTFGQYDTSSLLYCAMTAAPCPPPLVQQVRERFGCPVMIAFGATELAGAPLVTQITDADRLQLETVGRVFSEAEVKIVDDAHRELPPGQVGELACHMDSIMLGYYKAPEATAQAIDPDGWYYTGDLASIDDKGYVRIVGRKKDMIIRGGQNIFPAEIETFLQTHPKVQLSAVVGVPDPLGGESVWAFVVPKPHTTLSPQEVLDHCRGKIAPFKVPAEVRIVAELPMTPTAKVQKFRLRETAIAELEAKGLSLPGKEFLTGAAK